MAIGAGGGTLAEAPVSTNRRLYSDENPIEGIAFPVKIETLREIDAYARGADARVVQVSASIAASHQEIEILRPDGARFRDIRPMTRLNVSVIVDENGRRETGSAGGGGRVGLDGLLDPTDWRAKVDEALRIARVNLDAEPAPAGVMEVVLGPGWPGILLHEAVGHGLEGDFNRKGTSAFAGLMGQQVAARGVTVLDDGTLPDRRGSITFDDEGTPSNRTVLIEDGTLVGYMQDRQNARLMGVASTGNGRRQSYAHTPMPRMTNTYMLGGTSDPAGSCRRHSKTGSMLSRDLAAGRSISPMGKFVFSCTEAYRVKNGKIQSRHSKGATLDRRRRNRIETNLGNWATTWPWIQAWAIAARPANGCRWVLVNRLFS